MNDKNLGDVRGRSALQGERTGGGKAWRLNKVGVLGEHPRPEWLDQMRSERARAGPRTPFLDFTLHVVVGSFWTAEPRGGVIHTLF